MVFAATFVTLFAAHHVADHWIQTDRQAALKARADRVGRMACFAHVVVYTVVAAVFLGGTVVATGLRPDPWRVGFGLLVSAGTHYWADRRAPIARLAAATGRGELHRLGAPRPGHDDNPSLGTGAYVLDQSWHIGWLFVAALIVA